MASSEWERLKEALRKAPTPEARREAADVMRRYLATKPHKSKPTLVSLGYKKTYPSAIPLEQLPNEIERNPDFFALMKKVVTKEK